VFLAGEAACVKHRTKRHIGVKGIIVCKLQSQFQPFSNVRLKSCAETGKSIQSFTFVVVTSAKRSQIDSLGQVTRQQKAGFCIKAFEGFGESVNAVELNVVAYKDRAVGVDATSGFFRCVPEGAVDVSASFPAMSEQFRSYAPLFEMSAGNLISIKVTVAAQNCVPRRKYCRYPPPKLQASPP